MSNWKESDIQPFNGLPYLSNYPGDGIPVTRSLFIQIDPERADGVGLKDVNTHHALQIRVGWVQLYEDPPCVPILLLSSKFSPS